MPTKWGESLGADWPRIFFCFEGCCVAFESPTQAEIFAAEKMLQFEPQRKRIQRISVNLTNPKTHATPVLTFGEGWIVVPTTHCYGTFGLMI